MRYPVCSHHSSSLKRRHIPPRPSRLHPLPLSQPLPRCQAARRSRANFSRFSVFYYDFWNIYPSKGHFAPNFGPPDQTPAIWRPKGRGHFGGNRAISDRRCVRICRGPIPAGVFKSARKARTRTYTSRSSVRSLVSSECSNFIGEVDSTYSLSA